MLLCTRSWLTIMVSPGYSPEAQWSPFCWPRSPATKRHSHFGSNMVKRNGLLCSNMVKYSKEINSNIANKAGHISTQTRGDVCICTLYPPKYLAFAHRITPNIKDWFGCSDHPTHKSTNSYPDPDHEKVVNVDDNGDH